MGIEDMEKAVASFTRLRDGDWAVRVTGEGLRKKDITAFIKAEAPLVVRTKAGKETAVYPEFLLWFGKDNRTGLPVGLLKIEQQRKFSKFKRHSKGPCRKKCGSRYECDECGDWAYCGQGACWETGLAH